MVRVLPEARKRGIGSVLLEAARERATAIGRESMWGRVRDAESLAFAEKRGFRELTREITVLRKLRRGDGEAAPGIVPLRDEHLQQAYEVWAECLPEIHVPLVGEVPPYEEWLEREARADGPALVALDGDRVVGYARLCQTGLPHRLEHGLTAVRRSHRRRGLGSALKQAQIKWAADSGYRELTSEMVEGNAPMRALNERLGYRQLPPVIVVGGRPVAPGDRDPPREHGRRPRGVAAKCAAPSCRTSEHRASTSSGAPSSPATCTSSPSLDGELAGSGLVNRSDTGNAHVAPRVLPDKRGRGVGAALLEHLAAHAVGQGYSRAGSHVAGDDDHSIAFAQRFGFEELRRDVQQVLEVRRCPSRARSTASSSSRSRSSRISSRPRTRSRRRATRTCRSRGSTSRSRPGSSRAGRFRRGRSPHSPAARSWATRA